MLKNEIVQKWAKDYILGGKAMINFYNEQTKVSKKFTVYADYGLTKDSTFQQNAAAERARKTHDRSKILGFKVFSTEGHPKKEYVGYIRLDGIFSNVIRNNTPTELSRQFAFVWNHLQNLTLPAEYHILHMGSCSVCSRPLTDTDSILRGIGPICLKRMG